MLDQMFRGLALPEVLPWFDRVLLDTEGLIGIRLFDVPGSAGETWQVFDTSGEPVATVRSPAGFEISDVGRDVVLGITKDEFDVEYLEVRALQRD
jgi:hypothetical protein